MRAGSSVSASKGRICWGRTCVCVEYAGAVCVLGCVCLCQVNMGCMFVGLLVRVCYVDSCGMRVALFVCVSSM